MLHLRLQRASPQLGATPSSGRRLPGIEGLRALAATSVLVYHAWALSSPDGERVSVGQLTRVLPDLAFGVTLFFGLSGFLLYRPFAAAMLRGRERPSIRGYLRNRALRILPAYWVILLVSALALQTVLVRAGETLPAAAMTDLSTLARTLTFTQNYSPALLGSGIGPAWSLAVEAVFYLALPVLVVLTSILAARATGPRARRAAVAAPAAALLALGLAGKAAAVFLVTGPYGEWGPTWHSVLELSFVSQADLFAFGMAVAILHVEVEDGRVRLPRAWPWAAGAAALAGYAVVASTTTLDEQLSSSPANTLMALVCALLLALVVVARGGSRPPLLLRFLELRPLVYVGMVSYSVFLWHGPLVRWLARNGLTFGGAWGLAANVAVLFTVTLALSAVTYRFVEAPALRLKRRRPVAEPALPDVAPAVGG